MKATLTQQTAAYTKLVDPVIKELLKRGAQKQTEPLLMHQIRAGGKRLRPTLAFLSCEAAGGRPQDVLYEAAALEILHNYTLIIDDIIDDSPTRRGKPTTYKKYGQSFAECIGGQYAASLLYATAKTADPVGVADTLGDALKTVLDGEMKDVVFEQAGRTEPYLIKNRPATISMQKYYGMITQKTAVLLQASCELGARAGGATTRQTTALRAYGHNFGIAFQIQDDILDVYGGAAFGKPKGQDLREHKLGSILTLLALEECDASTHAFILKVLRSDTAPESSITKAIRYIKATRAQERATALGASYIAKAQKSLLRLPESRERDLLHELAESTIYREK